MHEAIARDVRQMHRVAGLLQAFGQRQEFGRTALQAVDQQHGVFTAGQRDRVHQIKVGNKRGGILANLDLPPFATCCSGAVILHDAAQAAAL